MKKFVVYISFFILVLISCEKDRLPKVEVDDVTIQNRVSSALVAKVLFRTNEPVNGYILYWQKGTPESVAKSTIIGTNTTSHSIPLLRLSENTEYNYRIMWKTMSDPSELRTFTTKKIPDWVKNFYNEEENKIKEETKGYYLFHNKSTPACAIVVNEKGEIVWYRTSDNKIQVAKITDEGTLLTIQDDLNSKFATGNTILESTFDGDTLRLLKKGVGSVNNFFHHDMAIDNNGNIVALVEIEKNGLPGEGIEVFNPNGQKIWEWSSLDGTELPENYIQPWSNSISINNKGDYIVSFRVTSQVWKIDSETGHVIWKLGKDSDFELDTNEQFMFQHNAVETADGKITMFDNGSEEQRPKSRVLQLVLNYDQMTVQTNLSHYLPSEYFSPYMGSAEILENNDMLLASATKGKIVTLKADGTVKWILTMNDKIYRVAYFKEFL